MISFIVIGKNEENNLERCIRSIYAGTAAANMHSFEIIYVDSNSSDRSILVAKQFRDVSIYKIDGPSNSALGRNVGAKESSGSVLFFLDADMELDNLFLLKVWNTKVHDITYDFVSGQITDISFGQKERRHMSLRYPGGTFLIRNNLWKSVNGMRTRFKTGEETDFALRLMKRGQKFVRLDENIVYHYTVPYLHGARIWKSLIEKKIFYNRAVLYRHHLFNVNILERMWRLDKTCLALFISLVISFLYFPLSAVLFSGYLGALFQRALKNNKYVANYKLVTFYLASDILNILCFFCFYPKDLQESYLKVTNKFTKPEFVRHEANN
jgi:glycosyltransferase involved in cell wall biosynthesis